MSANAGWQLNSMLHNGDPLLRGFFRLVLILALVWGFVATPGVAAQPAASTERSPIVPVSVPQPGRDVPQAEMQRVYDEVKTPFKYGVILRPGTNESFDCPSVFRFGNKWYMVYIAIKNKIGYETF